MFPTTFHLLAMGLYPVGSARYRYHELQHWLWTYRVWNGKGLS